MPRRGPGGNTDAAPAPYPQARRQVELPPWPLPLSRRPLVPGVDLPRGTGIAPYPVGQGSA
jgi:hypothetical protein